MKLFIVSDIHGCADEFFKGLEESGYQEKNKGHFLIVLGDLFDRGPNSLEVYNYLRDKERVLVIKGNHDTFFLKFLKGDSCLFNYLHNGFSTTLKSFMKGTYRENIFYKYCLENNKNPGEDEFYEWEIEIRKEINSIYPGLLPWLESLPDYYETDNYIFTHGSIDTKVDNWKMPKKEKGPLVGWEACAFSGEDFYKEPILNTKKVVVVGHFGTNHLRFIYGLKPGYGILKKRRNRKIEKIFIDSSVVMSHRINVLVIDREKIC